MNWKSRYISLLIATTPGDRKWWHCSPTGLVVTNWLGVATVADDAADAWLVQVFAGPVMIVLGPFTRRH